MRILVAMSGGVDSSVVAATLAGQGHEVIGATLQLYDVREGQAKAGACCAGRDIRDAKRVADRLGFAHYVIDAEQRFRDSVIGNFADSYASGETPVPCVQCNMGVKFTDLLGLARELGAEAMATGHYVRRVETARAVELHRPRDAARDQSWFLFATTAAQLDYLRFPLGEMADKAAVRAEALRLGLTVAAKPDSQDLCFVPGGEHYAGMVERLRPEIAGDGDIVSEDGQVLGRHQGIARYTVGQGRRLGAAAMQAGIRQQVVRVEPGSRRVVVGPRGDQAGRAALRLRGVNWLIDPPAGPLRCTVQLRARESVRQATVSATPDGAEVLLDAPSLAAPGQACVLYDRTRVLGGGFIRRDDS
ncbi:tRNA 2-thiouridine(34) synthase MnmA [Lichenicoccus sp.]|uniref:tRNA 2-thiouridine(34) synthase MnmA n=1 Tax=Lichenicoccus sp. TaxID=2781899 RepID=UPI003D0F9120